MLRDKFRLSQFPNFLMQLKNVHCAILISVQFCTVPEFLQL